MFQRDRFIQDCINARPGGQRALREVLARVVIAGPNLVAGRKETRRAGIEPLCRSAELTSALHVCGGDFFAPPQPGSERDHKSLTERPWDLEQTQAAFSEPRQDSIEHREQRRERT